jgi:hypothetical protein
MITRVDHTLNWTRCVTITIGCNMAWTRTDDLNGSAAQETTFGLFGQAYVLDAGEVTCAEMEAALRPFVAVARVYGQLPEVPSGFTAAPAIADRPPLSTQPQTKPTPPAPPADRTIRSWGNANGYGVGPKGRIPNRVRDAYFQANPLTYTS